MSRTPKPRARRRGSVDVLPSGAFRVRVYAGRDPLTRRPVYLSQVVPSGPNASQEAERIRVRMLGDIDERRNTNTRATVNQLIDRWLGVLDVDQSTRKGYEGHIRKHIRPLLGSLPLAELEVEVLDSFYAELRRCRDHCDGRRQIQHRIDGVHECDEHPAAPCAPADPESCRACSRMCQQHVCRGLADGTVRKIHWILSGALDRAVVWKWISVNPAEHAAKPPLPHPEPRPPTAEEASRLVQHAWSADPDWGALVWLMMTTGARRGEICGLRWSHVALDSGVITISRTIYVDRGQLREKDTKTHQQRRVVLDAETVAVLTGHRQRAEERAALLGETLSSDRYVFTNDPLSRDPRRPDGVSQRYERLAKSLKINTTLKDMRHYNATELINSGVDVRTVAGRLGHGGGGSTTLRVYTAWLSEADQRAARTISGRMPPRPTQAEPASAVVDASDGSAYKKIAADLRGAITLGLLKPGDALPTMKFLAARYGVAPSTTHRALADLARDGLIDTSRGRRSVVTG
ncbi:MAG TPA: tyrosine-type recombinase/integrase [Propionibacteriaceae bacterium]|nr:tyrosine-type recombinase/integrase [Propionibacteriaceae bacterium]